MKKKNLLLIFLTILGFSFAYVNQANAEYRISWDDTAYQSDKSLPSVRKYYSNIDGKTSMVYCLDPGLSFNYGQRVDWTIYKEESIISFSL